MCNGIRSRGPSWAGSSADHRTVQLARSAVQEPDRLVPEAGSLVLIEGVGGDSATEITWLGDDDSLVAVVEVTPGHPLDERGGGQQDGGGRALLSGFPARGDLHWAIVLVDRPYGAQGCLVEVALDVGHDAAGVQRVGGDGVGGP